MKGVELFHPGAADLCMYAARAGAAIVCVLVAMSAAAQQPPAHGTTIEVIGVTPIDGIGLDRAKFPTNAQRVERHEDADVVESLVRGASSTGQNDPQGGPLQSDLQFRGFSVSPLLGAPEGLAIFQDGVRLNEPFGDTIAWTAIPAAAIESMDVIPGANPVYGLNALGGVLAIRTRSQTQHTSLSAGSGSFGRFDGEIATGAERWFGSLSHLHDGGWRDFSPSDVTQLFASTKWSSGDVRVTLGRSMLTGNGAVPEELLEDDRAAVFTHPDNTRNDTAMISTRQQRAVSESTFVETNAYVRRTRTRTFNGDDSPYEPCEDADRSGLICLEDEIVRDHAGMPVPVRAGAPLDATNNRTHLAQTAFGAGLQLDRSRSIRGRSNRLIAGVSVDGGVAELRSSSELAELTPQRGTRGSGIVTADSLVRLTARSTTLSTFVADILALTPRLTITSTARLNHVRMRLEDRIDTALDGVHSFTQLHPSIGAAFEMSKRAGAFANVGITGRTPTPVELSCADPDDPCRLPNAFVSDPPLRPVIGRTVEVGFRGQAGRTSLSAAAYRSVSRDDLLFISSGPLRGEGHFANVGTTRRQGIELAADGGVGSRIAWSATYALIDARFITPFVVPAPNHPAAVEGETVVKAGDRLTLVPRYSARLGATVEITPRLTAGAWVRAAGRQFFRGDEANLATPLSSYSVTDARMDIRVVSAASIALEIRNVFDAEYATFGLFGDAEDVLGERYEDSTRFITPAPPRTVAVRAKFRF